MNATPGVPTSRAVPKAHAGSNTAAPNTTTPNTDTPNTATPNTEHRRTDTVTKACAEQSGTERRHADHDDTDTDAAAHHAAIRHHRASSRPNPEQQQILRSTRCPTP